MEHAVWSSVQLTFQMENVHNVLQDTNLKQQQDIASLNTAWVTINKIAKTA